jgi:hypothetical protein
MIVHLDLEEWEWDMVDAEADARGISRQELLHEMLAEGDVDDMHAAFQVRDRQWKSH